MKTLILISSFVFLLNTLASAVFKNLPKWEGVVHIYPNWHYVELTFPEGGNEGVAKFQPLHDYHHKVKMEHHVNAGSVPIAMKLDPILNRFEISITGKADNDKFGVTRALTGFEGYVIPPGNALVGYIGRGKSFTLFGSPEVFNEDLKVYLKYSNLKKKGSSRFPGDKLDSSRLVDMDISNEDVIVWFSRLKKEFPKVVFSKTRYGGELEHHCIRLFHDDSLKKAFGKSFDELEFYELHYIGNWFKKGFYSDDRRIKEMTGLGRLFLPSRGTSGAYQTQIWIIALKRIDKWREYQTQVLAKLPPEQAAQLTEIINKVTVAHFWPSEVIPLAQEAKLK